MPKGAFYAFPNVSGCSDGAAEGRRAVSRVRRRLRVPARRGPHRHVAGVDFGSDAHIRLSYATSLDKIQEGLRRMDTAVRSLQGA